MNIYCNNCGNEGHLYRHCNLPVLSYGILCFTQDKKILMIQRKDSIAYIEFLRGKYDLHKPTYIVELLNSCSVSERILINTLTFDELWSKLWFSDGNDRPQTERMIKEYNVSKKMFNILKPSDLDSYIAECDCNYDTPEWEFPKGRRSSREKNIVCAVREFEEETDLIKEEYTLLENIVPISEEYTGSNGVRYKHIYYYALYKGTKVLSINPEKHEQFSEIGDIKWLTIDECKSKIRVEHPTKLDIIQKVSEFMMNWNKDLILKE
tara:strand:+ start:53 stop:847 length:795 start_codon:yes stop_codon:yes gene_type:complete